MEHKQAILARVTNNRRHALRYAERDKTDVAGLIRQAMNGIMFNSTTPSVLPSTDLAQDDKFFVNQLFYDLAGYACISISGTEESLPKLSRGGSTFL